MTKLSWEWSDGDNCEIAWHNGYLIKAEHDDSASNPFEDDDCNWPIHIYAGHDGSWSYPKDADLLRGALTAFSPAQIVHSQIAIAQMLGTTIQEITCYGVGDSSEPVNYCWDADHLYENFWEALGNLYESKQLEAAAELYKLAGVPAYVGITRGYSQGDWAEVLVVATPEARSRLGSSDEWMRKRAMEEVLQLNVRVPDAGQSVLDAKIAELWEKDFEGTVELYGNWAWGNVFGYTLWAPTFDEDGEIDGWEQLDDSCWGFYGDDHEESGLAEAAMDAVPTAMLMHPEKHEEAA